MPRWIRWILTGIIIVLALLFWYIALTVPMISATAPAVIAIALTISVYFMWPKKKVLVSDIRQEESTKRTKLEDDQIVQAKKMKDAGWSNVSIASRLDISENSVRTILKG